MGSRFAGIKAVTLSGVLYFGGAAAFNAFLLFAFKADALSACGPTDGGQQTDSDLVWSIVMARA